MSQQASAFTLVTMDFNGQNNSLRIVDRNNLNQDNSQNRQDQNKNSPTIMQFGDGKIMIQGNVTKPSSYGSSSVPTPAQNNQTFTNLIPRP
jgi:hypothetical protein